MLIEEALKILGLKNSDSVYAARHAYQVLRRHYVEVHNFLKDGPEMKELDAAHEVLEAIARQREPRVRVRARSLDQSKAKVRVEPPKPYGRAKRLLNAGFWLIVAVALAWVTLYSLNFGLTYWMVPPVLAWLAVQYAKRIWNYRAKNLKYFFVR